MFRRLAEAVSGAVPNAVMPLFWQKGMPLEAIREEMERIGDAGIGAVILEARPHPDFLGDGWWRDVDAILEIARRRGMRVWFFDDDIFPTGHAAGAVEQAPAELRRRFLTEQHTDVVGPAPGASLILDRRLMWGPDAGRDPGTLLRVVAVPRSETSAELVGDPIDLTDRVVGGRLYWDVPDGWWRVFVLRVATGAGSARHANHLDYLSAGSVRLLIDAVYERVFARYGDEFGSTIAGFFSDEPGLYNDPETFDFASGLGKPVPLSWNDDVAAGLAERLGPRWLELLPLLWWPAAGRERAVRYAYMDTVSRLYSERFGRQLGDWCRAHGVEYIGHVIEDNGAHARLGPGAGHYFRAMAGQDMPGVDIIGGQVVPGFAHGPFGNVSGAADGEFFHFTLAKLASSAAHADPATSGRAVCETIGASGWTAGLRLFTWLTNHLLVRGVNHVVPHAFSPAPFPDPDCPPHFWAHGQNPQYRYQHLLTSYTNRLSHLLRGGQHVAPFAVLYHADAEWLGEAMPVDRPMRLLTEAQLDADIVPADALAGAVVSAGGLAARPGGERYDALIVPGSAFLPEPVARELRRLADDGLPVLFVDRVPEVVELARAGSAPRVLRGRFAAIPQGELVRTAAQLTDRAIRCSGPQPWLRALRVAHPEADVVMLVNESTRDRVCTTVTLPRAGSVVAFDAFTGTCRAVSSQVAGPVTRVPVDLVPGAAVVLICGAPAAWSGLRVAPGAVAGAGPAIRPRWTVSIAAADTPHEPGSPGEFVPWRDLDTLSPWNAPDALPGFSGTACYRATFESDATTGAHQLDLGEVFEIAEVRLNGAERGTRIAPPYLFDVPDGLLRAQNELEIFVTNTLVTAQPDVFSAFTQQDPAGLLGPVRLNRLEPSL